MKHSIYRLGVLLAALAACPLWAGYNPTATEINLGQFPIDNYFSVNGTTLPSCPSSYTIQQCVQYFFDNNFFTKLSQYNYVSQGVIGVRFLFSVGGGYSGSTPWDSNGNVRSQWVTNLQAFLNDLKGYGIQYVTPTPALIDYNWGYSYITPTPSVSNCQGGGSLVFLPWVPFGFDTYDNYWPDCQEFNNAYNVANSNPYFWGWSPFFNLAGAVFGAIQGSGLQMREFDVENELDLLDFTVVGRLIYDNAHSTDVLGTLRSLASSHGLTSSVITFSTGADQPSVSGFDCGSIYGDSAMIINESELIAGYAGGWSRVGIPNNLTQTNHLPCLNNSDPTGMISLPVVYSQPTLTDIHDSPCVVGGGSCDPSQDVTLTAETVYSDLWAFLVYRNMINNIMMIGETTSGQQCDNLMPIMATQNVDGYEQSALFANHASGTVLRPWSNDENPNAFIPPLGPPCYVVPYTINPPYTP